MLTYPACVESLIAPSPGSAIQTAVSWSIRVLPAVVLAGLIPRVAEATRVDGEVRLYAERESGTPTQPEAEVQLALRTKRIAGTRAIVKLEGHYYAQDCYIKDAYLDHRLNQTLSLRLGVDKKTLGLEYQLGNRQRLTLHRSNLYQTLESLALVGRQLELRLLRKPERGGDGLHADVGLGMDGSRNENALGSLRIQTSQVGFGAWSLLEHHRVDASYLWIWAFAASAWVDSRWVRVATELFSGVDAGATEFEREAGDGHRVVFYGPRSEVAVHLPLSRQWAFEPFVQGALLAHDAKRPSSGYRSVGLAGLNLRSKELVLRSNIEQVHEHTAMLGDEGNDLRRRTTYHASLAYSF